MSESRSVRRGGLEDAGDRALGSGMGRGVVVFVTLVAEMLSSGFRRALNLASVLHLMLEDS
jgi:hypothetical protein